MPLFINRDQIFAHQVHLLEHKLRSKEERILELETENAILQLRLAECLGKLRRDHEKETEALKHHLQQRNAQKITRSALAKLLSEVQAVKLDLSELFAVYLSFSTELEEHSKQLLDKVQQVSCSLKGDRGDEVQDLQAVLHNTLVELRGNIRVHCRVRPVLPFDHVPSSTPGSWPALSEEVVSTVSDDTVMVNCIKTGMPVHNKMYEFERVHGPEESQDAVFEEVKPLLTSLLDGYNVCIMAYGQTGSGKTHTMMGSQLLKEHSGGQQGTQPGAEQGIIPKAAAELFRMISEKPADSHTVEVSVMEVYNNEVLDLLAKDAQGNPVEQRCDVITTSNGASQVIALKYQPVRDASEVMQILSRVLKLRAHCPTLVHPDSSRSHLIVTSPFPPKAPTHWPWSAGSKCQEGHAAGRSEGMVEPTLSPCQPRRTQII
ncbi:Kinesin-like protein KIF25 [Dissostichus eleginoides]|uniref:Kinesin-like protein KIF25 n=1 Tax=Dissostichus eleginoides TaxID=100907 RepID=A0AAD9F4J9_DISEL|nr:Kinesin-like protein KIF25 [Dissostichus eleginoides]